ncbi:hypothetical protein CR513_22896, partial [Mucuna pruriens]
MVAKVCGICTSVEHPTDMCPTLQETDTGNSCIRIGHLIVSSMEDSHFSRDRIRDPMQLNNSGPHRIHIRDKQRVPTQGNSPSLEDLMKQLATNNLEFQQSVSSSNMQFQQNLATIVSQLQSAGSSNLPSQTIANPIGNASVLPRSAETDSKLNANSQSRLEKTVPTPFPTRTISTRRLESDEELLKMFRKVEINIPLLDAIKQVPKYAKFLKELCVHKQKKMKGNREIGGVVSALTRKEELIAGTQALPKKCKDPGIFSVPCIIGECTFTDAMLDLGASINVMPVSIYRSLNFGDLEPIGMTIQLANRSIVEPLGVLEDVLV